MKKLFKPIALIALILCFCSFTNHKKTYPQVTLQYAEFDYNIDGGYHNLLYGEIQFDQPIRVEYEMTFHYKQDGVDHISQYFYLDAGSTTFNILDEVPITEVYSDVYVNSVGPVFHPF